MGRAFFLLMVAHLLLCGCREKNSDPQGPIENSSLACINGVIYKYNTGNSTNALVQLLKDDIIIHGEEISADGSYKIINVREGDYTLRVWKLGYEDIDEDFGVKPVKINVRPNGECTRYDYPISKIPQTLNVVEINDPEKIKSILTFSDSKMEDHFRIYNNSTQTISWVIDWDAERADCKWLKSITHTSDIIKPGEGTDVIIRIDPEELNGGEEQTEIYINGGKEAGGWVLTLKVTSPSEPVLTTLYVNTNDITFTDAIFRAQMTSIGYPPYTIRGFEVAIEPDFSSIISFAEENPLTSNTEYSLSISELDSGRRYYVRAFATNILGTVYGREITPISFVTKALSPRITAVAQTLNGITATAEITDIGVPTYTIKGFCYSIVSSAPTIDDSKVIVSGTLKGLFSGDLNIKDLKPNKLYYVRAFAISDFDTVYSERMLCSTDTPLFYDKVLVDANTNSAKLSGFTFTKGNPSYFERGFEWYPVNNPSYRKTVSFQTVELGELVIEIIDLQRGTEYFVREFAVNPLGTFYGEWSSFKTNNTI